MLARMSWIALVLAAAPGVAIAQGFEYAPGTSQYRITQSTKVSQEAMGQKNEAETSSYQLFSLIVTRPHKDTLALAAILDSISQTTPMGPPPGLDKLVGMQADAKISPTGALYSASVKDSSVVGAIGLSEAVGRFFPRIRGRLSAGATWSDTTSGKIKQGGLEVDRRTISRYTVVRDTTVGGERGWKLSRSDSTSMTGTGTANGQPITMEGTSSGEGDLVVGQRGTFGGGQGQELSNVKIVFSANGLEVKIVQTANTKVEKVK